MAGGRTKNTDLKTIFMAETPRTMPMRWWMVPRREMSRYVANPIPVLYKLTITASWKLPTTTVHFLQLLTRFFHSLQAQSTLLLLLSEFHPLSCFKKVSTSPPSHPRLPGHPRLLRSPPLPLAHPPHRREDRESVRVRRPLLTKTEPRLRSLRPSQLRNMHGRWQSMRNGWLS